jgi:hypothetical protein
VRLVLLNNNLPPHFLVLTPQVAQLRRGFIDHRLSQLYQHCIKSSPDNYSVQRPLAYRILACVHLCCFRFLCQERLADVVVSIHQSTQIVTNLEEYVVRVGLGYLLHPLYFFVVLNLLGVRRILNLPELRLQIIQYFFYFTRCALDVLV